MGGKAISQFSCRINKCRLDRPWAGKHAEVSQAVACALHSASQAFLPCDALTIPVPERESSAASTLCSRAPSYQPWNSALQPGPPSPPLPAVVYVAAV
jgi:hypothetical protein